VGGWCVLNTKLFRFQSSSSKHMSGVWVYVCVCVWGGGGGGITPGLSEECRCCALKLEETPKNESILWTGVPTTVHTSKSVGIAKYIPSSTCSRPPPPSPPQNSSPFEVEGFAPVVDKAADAKALRCSRLSTLLVAVTVAVAVTVVMAATGLMPMFMAVVMVMAVFMVVSMAVFMVMLA